MNLNTLACRFSAKVSDALGNPLMIVAYTVVRFGLQAIHADAVVPFQSDFANYILLFMAAEQGRQSKKVEASVDELVRAVPDARPVE